MATKRLVVAGGSGFLGLRYMQMGRLTMDADLWFQDPGSANQLQRGAGR
jgi:hypothetical protein